MSGFPVNRLESAQAYPIKYEWHTCPECSGRGYFDGVMCEECCGTGEVEVMR